MGKFVLVSVFVFHVNLTLAQTPTDILAKYGKPISVHSMSPHIWMSPEYSESGQVCKMQLYSKRFDVDTTYLASQLPFVELKAVLNDLVPIANRGNKKPSFGQTTTGGGAAWTAYRYEKVTFLFVSPFKPQADAVLRPYEFSIGFTPGAPKEESLAPQVDDFLASQPFRTQVVTITWNDRTCAVQRSR